MEELFGYVLLIIVFVFTVIWFYGMFVLYVNRDSSKDEFEWFWTVRHNPQKWLHRCLFCNFFVGVVLFFSIIPSLSKRPLTSSPLFDDFLSWYILVLLFTTHILSYYGIHTLFYRIMKIEDNEKSNWDYYVRQLRKRSKKTEK